MLVTSYVSIDLETTGLNPKLDKIIEIGAVRVREGRETETFSALVNPGRKLEERIAKLTGISDGELAQAQELDRVLPELLEFLGDDPLIGHKILFDYSFLKKAAVDRRLEFEKTGIDTLKIARRYLPELEHKTLTFLCGYYGITHRAHRACADAQAASSLYLCLASGFYREGEALFLPEPLHYKAKRDAPASKAQKERLYRLIDRHKLVVDLDVEKLTRSEASRFADKILAAYGRSVPG